MIDRDLVAKFLADAHRDVENTITRIVRIVATTGESESSQPIKLLEVNEATTPSGIWPIAFTPDPPRVPYGSVVVEVTPGEYQDIVNGRLKLPDGWVLGDELYSAA